MMPYIKDVTLRMHQGVIRGRYFFSSLKPMKLLFDHLPKCGGSSLVGYLRENYLERKTFQTDYFNPTASVDYFKKLPQWRRHQYDLIIGHLTRELLDYVHPNCLRVTILREPVDRIISHYYYAKRTPEHYLYPRILASNMSLEDYATSRLSDELKNWYTCHFSGLTLDEAERNPELSITKAFEVLTKRYDIIGFVNDYSSFISVLSSQANLTCGNNNRRVNESHDRPNIGDIGKSTMAKIEQVNCLDVFLYNKILANLTHERVILRRQ